MTPAPDLSPQMLRAAFAAFPCGVAAVAGMESAAPVGMAASSFTSVSLEPPLVSVCVAHTSTTWPRLRGLPRLGLSVLADEHDELCRALAAKTGDRFARVEWTAASSGAVFIAGAAVWLDCSIENTVKAGDHDIEVLRIHDVEAHPDVSPLVFHSSRFRRLAV